MESVINLAGKELPVHVSIKTIIDYKSTFGTDILVVNNSLCKEVNG